MSRSSTSEDRVRSFADIADEGWVDADVDWKVDGEGVDWSVDDMTIRLGVERPACYILDRQKRAAFHIDFYAVDSFDETYVVVTGEVARSTQMHVTEVDVPSAVRVSMDDVPECLRRD